MLWNDAIMEMYGCTYSIEKQQNISAGYTNISWLPPEDVNKSRDILYFCRAEEAAKLKDSTGLSLMIFKGPSMPAEILGLNDVPEAGEIFVSPEKTTEQKVVDGIETTVERDTTDGERTHPVIGVDIRGNVYGGGNAAEVTGRTNVIIGKGQESSGNSESGAPSGSDNQQGGS